MKSGRDYSDFPRGKTLKKKEGEDCFERIYKSELVFQGRLSWWGISLRHWYDELSRKEERKPCCNAAQRLGYRGCCDVVYGRKAIYQADYLKELPTSRYGNNEFILSWSDIMESYMESRTDREVKDIYLTKAGTLRYSREICYVVMVSMGNDPIDGAPIFGEAKEDVYELSRGNKTIVDGAPILGEAKEDVCELSGGDKTIFDSYTDSTEKLTKHSPIFKTKHPFSWTKDEANISWENLVFAFYFPNNELCLNLKCPKDKVELESVYHDHKYCILKQKCPLYNCHNFFRSV